MARSISNSLSFSSRLVELECRMKNWQDRMNRILEYSLRKNFDEEEEEGEKN